MEKNCETLTPEQAFKAGFLMRCAEESLNEDNVIDRIQFGLRLEKQALFGIPGSETVKELGSGLGNALLATAIAAPVGVGALGGLAAAKSTSSVDNSVDSLKQQELIDTYNQLADDAQRRAKLKRKQLGLPHEGVVWHGADKDGGDDIKLSA